MNYFISKYGNIIKLESENVSLVPMDDSNLEYQQYVQFLESGGTLLQSEMYTAEEDLEFKTFYERDLYLKRMSDGAAAIAKFSAELRVAKLNGVISEEGHKVVDKALKPIRDEVLAGQWISAKDELVVLGTDIIGQNLYDRIYFEIDTYIQLNY